MGVTLGVYGAKDATGWTTITPSVDSTFTYVSNSTGNDTTGDGTQGNPYQTIAKGVAILNAKTNNMPHWLLFKCGDTWTDQQLGQLKRSGRSATEPLVITSYGTGARPLLKAASAATFLNISGSGGGAVGGSFVALIGIEGYAYTRNPSDPGYIASNIASQGVFIITPITWFLIENCKLTYFSGGTTFSFGVGDQCFDFIQRRNVIAFCYGQAGVAHCQGTFIDGCKNYIIEENIWDSNGFNLAAVNAPKTIFNHAIYCEPLDSGPKSVRGNLAINGSNTGFQLRAGGILNDNLVVQHGASGFHGLSWSIDNSIRDNICLEGNGVNNQGLGHAIGTTDPTGTQKLANVGTTVFENNIIAHNANGGTANIPLTIEQNTTGITIKNNVFNDWSNQPISDLGSGNIKVGNEMYLGGYADSNRSIATYMATLGKTASLAAFEVEILLQQKSNWRAEYTAPVVNDYIRGGFGRRKMLTVRT
jgi:hypothetical protein